MPLGDIIAAHRSSYNVHFLRGPAPPLASGGPGSGRSGASVGPGGAGFGCSGSHARTHACTH
eukprot:7662137-Alexandrium_andersonii.AAC.1